MNAVVLEFLYTGIFACSYRGIACDLHPQVSLLYFTHTSTWIYASSFRFRPDINSSVIISSPNAEETFELLSLPSTVSKSTVEHAATKLLDLGVGADGTGWVIIRSGGLGAYVASRGRKGEWIEAFWKDQSKVVDVTGEFRDASLCGWEITL